MINPSKRKSDLIHIIEILPDRETFALEIFTRFLISQIEDPVLKMLLMAEEDTEPLSEEEIAESEANRQAYLRGEGRQFREFAKELSDEE